MKEFIREIDKNKNLEVNLALYANYMMDLYNSRAAVEFAMDYYTFQGMIQDGNIKDSYLEGFTKRFNDIISKYVCETCVDKEREEAVRCIDNLRNEIFKVVEILTSYADIFSRYEYITNRYEYLFKEFDTSTNYNDEDFTREIMQYIFSEEDNALINSKISEVIAELPLRLTKNKFFELLSDGMSVYSKTDKETVDDFVYMIRTSGMISIPDNMKCYSELYEIYEDIKKINFLEITKDLFYNTEDKLRFAADFIERETNIYMMLQGLVNKAYVMILAAPYADRTKKESEGAFEIIKEINKTFYSEEYITLEDEITDKFIFIEGVPEKLHQVIQSSEYVLDNIKTNHLKLIKSLMLDKIYSGLFISEYLLEDSLFIDLSDAITIFDEESYESEEIDIQEYVVNKQNELIKEFMEFFKNNQKHINRSVMAVVISKLPVFFNNITEIQDYVYNSLSNCTNKAEKYASIEIIKSFMEN